MPIGTHHSRHPEIANEFYQNGVTGPIYNTPFPPFLIAC